MKYKFLIFSLLFCLLRPASLVGTGTARFAEAPARRARQVSSYPSADGLAGEIKHTIEFQTSGLTFSSQKGYDIVQLKGYGVTSEIGSPMLPLSVLHVLIPPGSEVTRVEIVSKDSEVLPGEYTIYPAQPLQPISSNKKEIKWVEPDKKVYSQATSYPEEIIICSGTGTMGGYRIAGLLVRPLQYIPSQKKLIFHTKIRFKIIYEENVCPVTPKTESQRKIFGDMVKPLVMNPLAISIWAPPLAHQFRSLTLTPDTVEYVIITDSTSYGSYFQPLVDWKTKKGIPSKIVDLLWIYSNYSGDNQERIRNFIIDAVNSWGTIWILLGGDTDVLPERKTWCMSAGGGWLDTIPSDLYYSDLDGSWDADGDGVYGEIEDGVDMYSDVWIGRASINTLQECSTFVNKIFIYEKNPPVYQKKELLLGEYLFGSNWGEWVNDSIADLTPSGYTISKLYESQGNLNASAVLDSIEAGYHFIHHAAHGNVNVISTGSDAIYNADLDSLTNGNLLPIYVAISCLPGAFDFDCYAEHFVNNPNGGGVAACMNSRFGWGSYTGMGPSEYLDISFFEQLFSYNIYKIGMTLGKGNAVYIPQAYSDPYYRWCIYELTLFGDPELPMWTQEPGSLIVTHNPVIPIGMTTFQVTVNNTGKASVESAYVCLLKDGEVYERDYTDASGNVTLLLSPPPASIGSLYVTVTKSNYKPYEGGALVISPSGPYLVYDHYTIIDTLEDNDSLVDAGESIELPVTIHNVGQDTAYGVSVILRTEDSYTTITDSLEDYGDILPGSCRVSVEDFDFDVDNTCPNNHTIYFTLEMKDINDSTWTSTFTIPVPTPILKLYSYIIDDDVVGESSGNDDGVPNPDETIELKVTLKNTGPEDASGVGAILSTTDPYITMIDTIEDFGSIPASDTVTSFDDFDFFIHSDCPKDHNVTFYLNIWDDDPASKDWVDSLKIMVWFPGEVLVVKDGESDLLHYFTDVLDSLNKSYDVRSPTQIDSSFLKLYSIVIWFTGYSFPTLTSTDQQNLISYLDCGGNLFITGQDIGWDIGGTYFYNNYLHANYISDDSYIYTLYGVAGDEIGDGLTISISGGDGANNQEYPSVISAKPEADSVFKYSGDGYGAIKYEGDYRVVYFAFGYEAINNFTDRKEVIERILNWLERGPLIRDVSVSPQYTQPESTVIINATITDPDSVLWALTEIESPDELIQDSVWLYDDGAHNDGMAGDNVYGNSWITLASPMDYLIDILAMDNDSNLTIKNNASWFTTIPPPDIEINPDSLGAELEMGDTTSQILTIKNIGGDTLTFNILESSTSLDLNLQVLEATFRKKSKKIEKHANTPDDASNVYKLPKVRLVKGTPGPFSPGEDTIYYDDGIIYYYSYDYTYWAQRFTPPQGCKIIGALVMTYMTGAPCSLFVWDDDGGLPGNIVAGPYAYTAGDLVWTRVDIPIEYIDNNDFWIGIYAPNQPYQVFDETCDAGRTYGSNDGINWYQYSVAGDVMIRVLVDYEYDVILWLSENPTEGTVPPGDSMNILISYNATGLTPDSTYYAFLKINSNDPYEPVVSVPCTLRVIPPDYYVEVTPEIQDLISFTGDTVWYSLNVRNRGLNDDSYDLTATGNNWTTTIWDSLGTTEITNTGLILQGQSVNIVIKVEISETAGNGEIDTVMVYATSTGEPTTSDYGEIRTTAQAMYSIPWQDGFEQGVNKWVLSGTGNWAIYAGTGQYGTGGAYEGDSVMVMTCATSGTYSWSYADAYFKLAGESNVFVDYYWRTYSLYASESEGIWLDIYDGSWHLGVDSLTGSDTDWQNVHLNLSGYNMINGFIVRFRAYMNYNESSDVAYVDKVKVYTPGLGSVAGTVTDAGTSLPIQDAVVGVEGTGLSDTTDVNGEYQVNNIEVGVYDVSCTATGYLPRTEHNVTVLINDTTIVDFAMTAPDIVINPDTLGSVSVPDDTTYQIMRISNLGTDTLVFNILESETPLRYAKVISKAFRTTDRNFKKNIEPIPNSSLFSKEALFQRLRLSSPISSVKPTGTLSPPSGTWELLLEDPDEPENTYDLHELYAQHSTDELYFKITTYQPWTDPDNDILAVIYLDTDQDSSTGYNSSYGYNMNDIGAEYAILFGIGYSDLWKWNSVSEEFEYYGPLSYLNLPWNSDSAEAGVFISDISGYKTALNPIDILTEFYDLYSYYIDYAPDSTCGHVTYPSGIDWLSEDPTQGIVPPGDSIDILISYDAVGLSMDSTYYAFLKINSNDPDEPIISIPCSLHIMGMPVLSYYSHTIDDDSFGESSGDGDGIPEAGETIELPVTLINTGTDSAYKVISVISNSNEWVTLIDTIEEFGALPPGTTGTTLDDYVFSIDSECPDNETATFILSIIDTTGYSWVDSFNVILRHFSVISGKITDKATGDGILGAIVSYTGPINGADTTDLGGNYEITNLPGGTYTLIASASGFLDSKPVTAPVPPDTDVFFALGAPDIKVIPDSLNAILVIGDTTSQVMKISNSGSDTLTFNIFESVRTGNISPKKVKTYYQRRHYSVEGKDFYSPRVGAGFTSGGTGFQPVKAHSQDGCATKPQGLPHAESTPLQSILFSDDMESGIGDWTTIDYSGNGNLWHQVSSHLYVDPAYHSPTHSWWCGIDSTGNYNSGSAVTNALVSPSLNLAGYDSVKFSFWEYYQTELTWDIVEIHISTDGINWTPLRSGTSGNSGIWVETRFDISSYIDNIIKLRFYFDTQDGYQNNYYGWLIDDVSVTGYGGGVDWLSEEPQEGAIPPDDSIDVIVSYNTQWLMPDSTYRVMLNINSNDLDEKVVYIPVSLQVIYPSGDILPVVITNPLDTVYVDSTYTLQALVTNQGSNMVDFPVICIIDTSDNLIYADTQYVSDINGGDTLLVTFQSASGGWAVPSPRTDYRIRVITLFSNDTIPSNDTLSVIIHEYNDSPVVSGFAYIVFPEDSFYTINLNNYVFDTDDPDSELSWDYEIAGIAKKNKGVPVLECPAHRTMCGIVACLAYCESRRACKITDFALQTDDYPIHVEINDTSHLATITADTNWYGFANIVFKATDSWGGDGCDTLMTIITPINDPPVIDSFSPESLCTTYTDSTLWLYVYAHDPDLKDTLTYEWRRNGVLDTTGLMSAYSYLSSVPTVDTVKVVVSDKSLKDSTQWVIVVKVGVEEELIPLPKSFAIRQNSPNPFSGQTAIRYQIPEGEQDIGLAKSRNPKELSYIFVTLKIYDITGSLVRTLVDEPQQPGYYRVSWDGCAQNGRKVPSGIYFCQIKAGKFTEIKKAILIR
ncbi:carboxypeptidase regulatory-like domain-containing protein [candidate division WOR-3 bacterium]|nr:carboxypeptidase regulatory-like domain-containing protein [candidate division WOR-3 bacterium]